MELASPFLDDAIPLSFRELRMDVRGSRVSLLPVLSDRNQKKSEYREERNAKQQRTGAIALERGVRDGQHDRSDPDSGDSARTSPSRVSFKNNMLGAAQLEGLRSWRQRTGSNGVLSAKLMNDDDREDPDSGDWPRTSPSMVFFPNNVLAAPRREGLRSWRQRFGVEQCSGREFDDRC
jgi:hypothetical protein